MNAHQQPNDGDADREAIADRNVEQLLAKAYRPEVPDAEFASRVEAQMYAAVDRRLARAAARPRRRDWQDLISWSMAAALLVGGAYLIYRAGPGDPAFEREGDFASIDHPSETSAGTRPTTSPPLARPRVANRRLAAIEVRDSSDRLMAETSLVARLRPPAPRVETLPIGKAIATGRAEKRRIALSDGSIVYVNENTRLQLDADRRITLTSGEIFLEVAPRKAVGPQDAAATFVVETPARQVTALGTKFAVRAGSGGTGVVVTQGRVKVSDFDTPLRAGQQLEPQPGGARVLPARRASVALDWTRDLMAAAESPLVPASKHRGGRLEAFDPGGQEAKISLRKYHVDVHIEDGFARTTIDQTYFNHEPRRLEGTFYFPLPPDASLSRLAMYVSGRLMEGGMAERDYARQVFETIKYRSLDPALLEWVDGSTFKMRVFPLEGRQEKRIILSYTQRLDNNYGRTQYRFPAGHSMGRVRDWSVQVRVRGAGGMPWTCQSHDLAASNAAGDLVLTASARGVKPDKDLVLGLHDRPAESQAARLARFSTFDHEESRYLMLRYRPTFDVQPRRPQRDWVFVVETSGDRNPILARVQVDLVRALLDSAEHDDTLTILTAANRLRALADEPLPATPENVARAVEFLESSHLVGALDLESALAAAGRLTQKVKNPLFVHIGSGLPILGEREQDALVDRLAEKVPYVGVGVGKRFNCALMKTAAARTGGYFTQINPDEPTRWRAFELLSTLNTPRMLGIDVADPHGKAEFLTIEDSLADGQELCAIARLKSGQPLPKSLVVAGRIDGQPYRKETPVEGVADKAGYLPRTWAKLEIDRLLAAGAQEHKQQIIDLSKAMYVMSPFTSLIVLENDQMYTQYNVDRGRKDHWALYPCPEKIKVVHEPLTHGRQPRPVAAEAPKETRPGAPQVLDTLLVRVPPRFLDRPGRASNNGNEQQFAPLIVASGPSFPGPQVTLQRGASSTNNKRDVLTGAFAVENLPADEAIALARRWSVLYENSSNVDLLAASPLFGLSRPQERLRRVIAHDVDLVHSHVRDTRTERVRAYSWEVLNGASLDIHDNSTVVRSFEDITINGGLTMNGTAGTRGSESDYETLIRGLSPEHYFPVDETSAADGVARLQDSTRSLGAGSHVGGLLSFDHGGAFSATGVFPGIQGVDDRTRTMSLSGGDTTDGHHFDTNITTTGTAGRYFRPNMGSGNLALGAYGGSAMTGVDFGPGSSSIIPNIGGAYRDGREDAVTINSWVMTDTFGDGGFGGNPSRQGRLFQTELDVAGSGINVTGGSPVLTPAGTVTDSNTAGAQWDGGIDEMAIYTRLLHHNEMERLYRAGLARSASPRTSMQRGHRRSVVYPQPIVTNDLFVYRDLVAFAPGMQTSRDDMLAVLEEEAAGPPAPKSGHIDKAARALVDRARGRGWQTVSLGDKKDRSTLDFDGSGRFRLERRTGHGLRETVVCNGDTLWHLYPELAIGAKRRVSRFHRAQIHALIPWLVPAAEVLAQAADLRVMGEQTVAIVPLGAEQRKGKEREPARYRRIELVFGDEGRLVERRLVAMPSGETLARVTYAADGTIRWLDKDAKELGKHQLAVAPAAAANVAPEVAKLVVLPMPLRTPQHVRQSVTGRTQGRDFAEWSEEDALRMLAANLYVNHDEVYEIIARRFLQKGDCRLGFYTLLLSSGHQWTADKPAVHLDPVAEHPDAPLAQYIATQLRVNAQGTQEDPPLVEGPPNNFITQLAELRRHQIRWQSGRASSSKPAARQKELDQVFEFIARCPSPTFAYALLRHVQKDSSDSDTHRRVAKLLEQWSETGGTSYALRYELARALLRCGNRQEARQAFSDLYRDRLAAGVLPLIDSDFFGAFNENRDTQAERQKLFRETAASLAVAGRRPTAITLVWQCKQLGDSALADELLAEMLAEVPDEQRFATTLAAVDYLWQTSQFPRADAVLASLLEEERYANNPSLWRRAAQIAKGRNMTARALGMQEKALDLVYEHAQGTINLQRLRHDYGQLLNEFQKLATAMATLDQEPPEGFVSHVVRAADRWRSLDDDPTAACHAAGRILHTLGAERLAWDYLTTPLADKPNESAPWLSLARSLTSDDDVELADRAYRAAYEAEPTNAQILWDHAQWLKQHGRSEAARERYQQIVETEWQPRFQSIQQQARQILRQPD